MKKPACKGLDKGHDVYNDVYGMKMVRKQIYITEDQDAKLKRLASGRDGTEAEVVRAAIDAFEGVAYEIGGVAPGGRLREVAVMEYTTTRESAATRGTGASKNSLADTIWQEEVAFIKSLGGGARGTRAEGAWKFNREELYEERESQILRRH